MLNNASRSRDEVIKVARALGKLNREVVFVGGAVVSFYTNDSAALDARPTNDVGITIDTASLGELEMLR